MSPIQTNKRTNFRWMVCSMLFFAIMINYMDRQVLSLTWKDFISLEFAWNNEDYSHITSLFSLVYAVSMLFAGKFVDIVGIRKGYAWAMAIWSFGAILHAFCGIATCGMLTGEWYVGFNGAKETLHDFGVAGLPITTMSIHMFLVCNFIMAIGQAGNFPAAIKATTEYFPKRDRAYIISIFNNGASVGALIAPVTIPTIAKSIGWEMAFLIVGAIGYIWMLFWILLYMKPQQNYHVNQAEINYIQQDYNINNITHINDNDFTKTSEEKRKGILQCLADSHTWALIVGKFMTDGVWWFFLFWTPIYIYDFYGYTADSTTGTMLLVLLYLISMLSIAGGYLPTYFITKQGMPPKASRMRAMLLSAIVQLVGVMAVPLGYYSPWLFIIIVGLMCAAHQSWSANLFSMVGDHFPQNCVGTVTGIMGMAGGVASFLVLKYTGTVLTYADKSSETFVFMSYTGKQAAYMLIFCCFSLMYLAGWALIRGILPNYGNNKE